MLFDFWLLFLTKDLRTNFLCWLEFLGLAYWTPFPIEFLRECFVVPFFEIDVEGFRVSPTDCLRVSKSWTAFLISDSWEPEKNCW